MGSNCYCCPDVNSQYTGGDVEKKHYPIKDGCLDTDQLSQQVDWSRLSEIEKVVVANLQADYRVLASEVRQSPELATCRWGGGETLLHYAANDAELELVELLISLGADVNARGVSSGTPLHAAAGSGSVPIVEILLRNGADVNAVDGNGHVPIYRAAIAHCYAICDLLLQNGATAQDEYTKKYLSEVGL
jgi:ankyrin repeat protein